MKALVAAFVLIASGLQTATYDLIWKPKEGQKLTYGLKIDGELLEKPFTISGDVLMNVKKVETNGDYTLGTSFKNMKAVFFGDEQVQPDEAEEVQKFSARGELLSEKTKEDEEGDVVSELFSRAGEYQAPPKPVAIGEKWTHEFPADKKLGLPKAKGTYQLLSETTDQLKVSIDYEELSGNEPTSAKGTATVQKSDGLPISVESSVKNLRFQEGVPPGTAKLTMAKK